MYEDFVRPIEYFAETVVDGVSGFLGFDGTELRPVLVDESVALPADLFAHTDVQTEWWYYTGHCETETGRRFGFELVFFKRRTDLDRLGIFPLWALANPMYFAHFAISAIDDQRFRYEHLRSLNKPFNVPVSMSETTYDLRFGDWSAREVAGKHILHGTMKDGFVFDAILVARKPVVLNGETGTGINHKTRGASKHFSFTRMSVSGQTAKDGKIEKFAGSAWMDREFGTWEQTKWDWFSIQFSDLTELMIYQYLSEAGEPTADSTGTFIDRDGACCYLKREDYEITVTSTWTSERTGTEYPGGWRIEVPSLDLDIKVEPMIEDQELDTRGSTVIVYWEGACRVEGTRSGEQVDGRAYVELVGYDRSHETAGLGDFLFGDPIKWIRDLFG